MTGRKCEGSEEATFVDHVARRVGLAEVYVDELVDEDGRWEAIYIPALGIGCMSSSCQTEAPVSLPATPVCPLVPWPGPSSTQVSYTPTPPCGSGPASIVQMAVPSSFTTVLISNLQIDEYSFSLLSWGETRRGKR